MPALKGHTWETWEWDTKGKSPDAFLSPCGQAVYFHISPLLESHGTAGVRGSFSYGEHYWEIEFLEPPYGTSVMVGVGMDSESWGLSYKGLLWHNGKSRKYTEPFYDKNTVIGVLLNRTAGTLTFYRNGDNLGLAFSGLDQVCSALYPMVSSTAPETELLLGLRTSRLSSLQEHCMHTITHCLGRFGHTHSLPLPPALRCQIHT
ncbi:SPRY domain-containing SOCS box protein 3-like [Hoplias malabaricus]|uniref:SPRY domain-containing SOCS box protein 3-like n=1 Tax=Hoplias malabaricus TaxID=27720 RepID=UPI003462F9DA